MTRIVYVQQDGSRLSVQASKGDTVMRTAIDNAVPGIVAECGGAAMCATCHVYLDPASADLLPPVGEVENEMLASAASERRPNSRLSCQLVVDDGMEELIVHIPARQV